MKYLFTIILFLSLVVASFSQVKPSDFQEKDTPGDLDAIYTQENEQEGNRKVLFKVAREKYFLPSIRPGVVNEVSSSGNSYRGQFVRDTSNKVYYVDGIGQALTFGYPSQGTESDSVNVYQGESFADTSLVAANEGDIFFVDSLTFAFRGGSKWLIANVDPLTVGIGANGVIDPISNSFSYSDYLTVSPGTIELRPENPSSSTFFNLAAPQVYDEDLVFRFLRGSGNANRAFIRFDDYYRNAFGFGLLRGQDTTNYTLAIAANNPSPLTESSLWRIDETGTIDHAEYGQGNKTAATLSKTESKYLAQYADDGTLLESSLLTLEDTALVLGANRIYTNGSYVLNFGLNNSAYNANDYASLFVGTRNFSKAGRSVFHFAVGDDIFPDYISTGRQLFGFGSTILPSLQVGSDIFAFGDKVAINATSASNSFLFGNFDIRNCLDVSDSFIFNAGNWENLKESSGSIILSTFIGNPVENLSADSTANNSFLALGNALKNAVNKDDAVAIGRNAGENSVGLQPIVFGKDCQGTTVDYQSIVAPSYYRRLSAGQYDFDIDQNTTNRQGQALRLGEDGEIRFIKVEQSGSNNNITDSNGDLTISHNLGTDAITITATTTGTTFYHAQVHSKTSTDFAIRFFDATGAVVTATAVSVDWQAVKQ